CFIVADLGCQQHALSIGKFHSAGSGNHSGCLVVAELIRLHEHLSRLGKGDVGGGACIVADRLGVCGLAERMRSQQRCCQNKEAAFATHTHPLPLAHLCLSPPTVQNRPHSARSLSSNRLRGEREPQAPKASPPRTGPRQPEPREESPTALARGTGCPKNRPRIRRECRLEPSGEGRPSGLCAWKRPL